MRVAIYTRVSTDKQDAENQLPQLREFAAKQGWQIVREYVDQGESGTRSDRAALLQMFEDASRKRFDLLLFWALDRLSREGTFKTLQHLNRLDSYGVGYRSFIEPYFDSCGIFKEAVISIIATLAKQEAVLKSERTKAGLARARSRGKVLGRRRAIHHTPADIAGLRAHGMSFRAIGRQLGISEGSVRRIAA
jgi:DNA invertase Pin-like site-specific DNA recombinase